MTTPNPQASKPPELDEVIEVIRESAYRRGYDDGFRVARNSLIIGAIIGALIGFFLWNVFLEPVLP